LNYELPGTLVKVFYYGYWISNGGKDSYPLLNKEDYSNLKDKNFPKFLLLDANEADDKFLRGISDDKNLAVILSCKDEPAYLRLREIFELIIKCGVIAPVIIKRNFAEIKEEEFLVYPAVDTGGLLIDGCGDGIWLEAESVSLKVINSVSFGILQASRTRISKTEYISCPSCGRTLFDLQETTAKVREKTSHLKGLKIGIMGCIVNGPGEMADADYGYVGSGVGKITLYKGKEVVKRNINSEGAVEELIQLIKDNNDWIEP
jgi:(E)-4-hydroxy-3-methylbut-2-enyl-diphosphate synthase